MIEPKLTQLNRWWQSPLGQIVLTMEKQALADIYPQLTGHFYLQIGGPESLWPATNGHVEHFIIGAAGGVQTLTTELPIRKRSIDNILLHHVLEFSDNPHLSLRQAERSIVTGGKLVLISYSPFSFWGLRRLFSLQDEAPWHGRYFSQTRIKDWLALLNFEVIQQQKLFYRVPCKSERWQQRFSFMERWGKRFFPFLGGISIVVAKKRGIPLTPARPSWRERPIFATPKLVSKPASREDIDGSC